MSYPGQKPIVAARPLLQPYGQLRRSFIQQEGGPCSGLCGVTPIAEAGRLITSQAAACCWLRFLFGTLGYLVSAQHAGRSCGSDSYDKFVLRQLNFHGEVEVGLQPKIDVVPRDGCVYGVTFSLLLDQCAMTVVFYKANACNCCDFCQRIR